MRRNADKGTPVRDSPGQPEICCQDWLPVQVPADGTQESGMLFPMGLPVTEAALQGWDLPLPHFCGAFVPSQGHKPSLGTAGDTQM